MRKKANFKPKICIRCNKEYTPNGAVQQYCKECSQIRAKERKEKWYKEHYRYSTKPKKCLEPCCVCGGEFIAHINGKPYCQEHYHRLHKYGTIEQTKRNTYEIDGEVLKIYTFKGELIIADLKDSEKLRRHSWCISKTGYPVANINHKTVKLHRYLLDLKDPNLVVDHINHNPLDNRRCNMRVCTTYENSLNQSKKKKSIMPIGVRKTKSNKYQARIFVNGKEINLGRYEKIEDAIKARNEAEIRFRGEFAQHLGLSQYVGGE